MKMANLMSMFEDGKMQTFLERAKLLINENVVPIEEENKIKFENNMKN